MTFTPADEANRLISSRWQVIVGAKWNIAFGVKQNPENQDFNSRGNLFWCSPLRDGGKQPGFIQMLVLFCFDEIQDRNKLAWEDPIKI
jgi:hypothetical protein